MVLAAVSGSRGLSRSGSVPNRVMFAFYFVGTALTLVGGGLLVFGAAVTGT